MQVQTTKIAAPEGAALNKTYHPQDSTEQEIAQAVMALKYGLGDLRQFMSVVAVQCYVGGQIEVQVASIKDLEYLPGELAVSVRFSGKYPYKASKSVCGIEFSVLLKEDPNATR